MSDSYSLESNKMRSWIIIIAFIVAFAISLEMNKLKFTRNQSFDNKYTASNVDVFPHFIKTPVMHGEYILDMTLDLDHEEGYILYRKVNLSDSDGFSDFMLDLIVKMCFDDFDEECAYTSANPR